MVGLTFQFKLSIESNFIKIGLKKCKCKKTINWMIYRILFICWTEYLKRFSRFWHEEIIDIHIIFSLLKGFIDKTYIHPCFFQYLHLFQLFRGNEILYIKGRLYLQLMDQVSKKKMSIYMLDYLLVNGHFFWDNLYFSDIGVFFVWWRPIIRCSF